VSPTPSKQAVLDNLVANKPAFHHDGSREQVWSAREETLRYLAEAVKPSDRTVETGAGASTVIFAATGATHTAISPVPREHRVIERYCQEHGIPTDRLEFIEGYAEEILPSYYPAPVDLAFIDGKHCFPYPIIDWHYLCNSLKLGGLMVVDDVRAPAVEVLCRIMLADPGWRLEATPDREAAAFKRVAEPPQGDPWQQQRLASTEDLAQHLNTMPSAPGPRGGALLQRLLGRRM
jgi:predicted O-methyltransferase YrrM